MSQPDPLKAASRPAAAPDGIRASQYAVLSFYPDVARGECINLAVVAFGGGRVLWRTTEDWARVEAFAGKRLAGFAQTVLQALQGEAEAELRARLGERGPFSSFVLSEAHGSLGTIDDCVDSTAKFYLGKP